MSFPRVSLQRSSSLLQVARIRHTSNSSHHVCFSTTTAETSSSNFVPTLKRPLPWVRVDQPQCTPLAWSPNSKRSGVIGMKMGMMQIYDHWGVRTPVTVIQVQNCQVVCVRPEPNTKSGLIGLQLGSGTAKLKRVNKSELGHYKKAQVEPKRKLAEFWVTPDAVLPLGWSMNALHFLPGQFVDIQGVTMGKGFQGPMKRWGFAGLVATHGCSVSHRSHGSTGSAQDPGRVFPGKKMAGHMGTLNKTISNLKVYKLDSKRNLIYVMGAVPGYKGNWVIVKDAAKKQFDPTNPPPFPTYIPTEGEEVPEELVMNPSSEDPFAYGDA